MVREIETAGRVIGEYMVLRGPAPADLPALRALGYRPEELANVEAARVTREAELAAMQFRDQQPAPPRAQRSA
ncbi:hypothetical protein Q5425_02910 [Amycolatopsis sp. A133]|uniref:hypothetical protein n=1 Tax=Amycolatopsis sp. A133 TaxID=3064472 RepID=UPI0027EBE1E6|nr:hypothetical protein [Amycolatopsis sp. A133]MDQ7802666.1 hypothetical protein [Amycolatopsis sp. A133]